MLLFDYSMINYKLFTIYKDYYEFIIASLKYCNFNIILFLLS